MSDVEVKRARRIFWKPIKSQRRPVLRFVLRIARRALIEIEAVNDPLRGGEASTTCFGDDDG